MIKFSCEKCQKPLQGKDDLLNKTIRCPKCKQPTKVLAKTNPVKQGELEDLAAQALIEEQDDKKEAQKTVKFTCFFCDTEIEVSVEFAGRQAPCPECRRITKVPGVAKNETQDWRKAGEKKKLLVEQQRQEELEGEWGTRTAGRKAAAMPRVDLIR